MPKKRLNSDVSGLPISGLGMSRSNSTDSAFRFRQPLSPDDLLIGKNGTEEQILKPELREHHTHIIGATGTGKSKFLELLARHDVKRGTAGLCLLDPHGSLYDDLLEYVAAEHPELADRIILFNPAESADHIVGFNPVSAGGDEVEYLIDSLISACLKAWGQDDVDRTPRITKWLGNIFYTLICNDLTLVESQPFLSTRNKDHRAILLGNVNNDLIEDDWHMFERSSDTQKQTLIEGAANRLRKFLSNGIIRNIIGQQEHILDFGRIMSEGKIVLINLNGKTKISSENSKLLGVLLVNEIFRSAKLRDFRDPELKPFYFYIDEFAQFMTRDIARALEEARKFGLRMILAHQHLAQLRDEDEYLYSSVLTNCKNKIVFGGLTREDAQIMTNEIATGHLNLKDIKEERETIKYKPVLQKRTVRNSSHTNSNSSTESESENTQQSSSTSQSASTSAQSSHNKGRTTPLYGSNATDSSTSGNVSGSSSSNSRNDGYSSGSQTGKSNTESQSNTEGESETYVTDHEEYSEIASRTFWSLRELEYMKMAEVKNQGVAEAFMKFWDQEPKHIKVTFVESASAKTNQIEDTITRSILANQDCVLPLNKAKNNLTERQTATFGSALRFGDIEVPVEQIETEDHGPDKTNDPFT